MFRKILYYHLPVILYGAAVLAVSSIPYLRTPEVRFLVFDKLAHFVEYALFAFLAFRSVVNLGLKARIEVLILLVLLFTATFALVDEFAVQRYTPGRIPSIGDYLTDLSGAVLVLVLLWLRRRNQRRLES